MTRLGAAQVDAFRAALVGVLARRDNRGYEFFAGWHGVPFQLCQHHNPYFLPWHRGYLYHVELALQEVDASVTLPWWDWVDEAGIPDAYSHKTVNRKRNALYDAPIQPYGVPTRPGWPTRTYRELGKPMNPAPLGPPLRPRYAWLMAAPSFTEFNRRVTLLHDNIHVWVGGTMGDPNWAAYDPIFWAHHTMVDRLWRIWQHQHPGAAMPQDVMAASMTYARAPSFRGSQLVDVKALGYDYAAVTASVPGSS